MTFWIACKRLARKRSALLLLFLLPLCVLLTGLMLPKGSLSLPPAGLYADLSQPKTAAFVQRLCADATAFQLTADADTLRQGVQDGTFDCGFLLQPNMEQVLTEGSRIPAVTLYTSPLSLRSEIFRMRFFSAFMGEISPFLCNDVLQEHGIPASVEEMEERLSLHADLDNRLSIETQTIDGIVLETDPAAVTLRAFLLGLFSLFLCSCSIVYASLFSPSQLKDIRLVAPVKALWRCILLPCFFAELCFLLLFGLGSLVLLPLFGIAVSSSEVLALLGYLLFLSGFSLFLAAVFFKGQHIIRLLPPVLCLSLFLCPILIDLPQAFPVLKLPAMLLPTHMFFTFLELSFPVVLLISCISILLGMAALQFRLYVSAQNKHKKR